MHNILEHVRKAFKNLSLVIKEPGIPVEVENIYQKLIGWWSISFA